VAKNQRVVEVPDVKVCRNCGAEFRRPEGMRVASWRDRIVCSSECHRKGWKSARFGPPRAYSTTTGAE